ncbi:hypothetical protein HY571_02640 [Candidatus Micrarchaeota archaeon]|nr:hypothetical protein [Candidatus Micrarchaeota archaeon]
MKTGILLAVLALLVLPAHAQFTDVNTGQLDLQEIRDLVNKNSGAIPLGIRSVFGNERVNLHLQEKVFGIVTKNAKIESIGAALSDPTLNVYADTATINAMVTGQLDLDSALSSGKLRYEAVDTITKVKMIIVEIAKLVFSMFG